MKLSIYHPSKTIVWLGQGCLPLCTQHVSELHSVNLVTTGSATKIKLIYILFCTNIYFIYLFVKDVSTWRSTNTHSTF